MSKVVYLSWIPVFLLAVYGCVTMKHTQYNVQCFTPTGVFTKENADVTFPSTGYTSIKMEDGKTLSFSPGMCIIVSYEP